MHNAVFEEVDDYEDVPIDDTESALEYFYMFFSEDILQDIVEQTNLYYVQETGKTTVIVTLNDMKKFIAIHSLMGNVVMKSYLDYWCHKYRYAQIADIMPLKKYQQMRRYIHFNDSNFEDSDRYYKVRPVMEKVRQNCLKYETERKFSVDEMMIAYKGTKAGKRRQYMKDKPNKWGFKNFVRSGLSGMIYDFVMYGGDDTFRSHKFNKQESTLGLGAQVVIALCRTIKRKPAVVCFDNFFSSPEKVFFLREHYGIFSIGTIRSNRMRGAQDLLISEKALKKKERGSYSQVVDKKNKLAVLRWNDNKCVNLISSYTDAEPVQKISRFSKEAKARIDVDCPNIVKQYNKLMGGVDLSDMLIFLYKTPFKSRLALVPCNICTNDRYMHC